MILREFLAVRRKRIVISKRNDHIVTWALGHLVSLADPEQYGKEYKEWNMDVLPMMPKHWKLTVLKRHQTIPDSKEITPSK